jgi:hypothetical protein
MLMNLDRHISIPQITWVVGTLIGLAMAVFLGSAVGGQDFARVVLVLGAFIGAGIFIALGKNYWMLIPFSLGVSFPAVPLGGRAIEFPELAIAGCAAMFAIRLATRKEKLVVFRSVNVPILLFVAWVGMVFAMHPVGFAMLGSEQGGGRFYLKLGLAFSAFLILSSRTYSERDIKWIFGFLIFGAFFTLFYNFAFTVIGGPVVDPATGMVQDEFYTWHQTLSAPAMTIAFFICAKWSPREIWSLQRPWLVVVYAICFIMVLMSGKRMALAAVVLAPLVSAIMFRQYVYIFVALMVAFTASSVLVAGQGQWFKLPLLAQRTLSWLPGDWDPQLQGMTGGTDEWRAELRFLAKELIKQNPVIGHGFAVDISDTTVAVTMAQRGGALDVQVAGYALGRSWHNRWLGYAADFGLPLSVAQAIIFMVIIIMSVRCFGYYGNRQLLGVFALYVLIYTVRDVVASHTSGHTSLDAWQRWWMYGVLASIYVQILQKKAEVLTPARQLCFKPERGIKSATRSPLGAQALRSTPRL